ncbi:hypothetical protein [Streptomyces albidoflavus]|uniref:hypothetical protein n=1 Tax=Streptomyces albidoflavus TaxID=1886 RepID=UPI0033E223B4
MEPSEDGQGGEEAFDALLEASSLGAPRVRGAGEYIEQMCPGGMERFRRAIARAELRLLLEREEELSGEQLMRVGELADILFDAQAARIWYERAATAGNEDAVVLLRLIDREE